MSLGLGRHKVLDSKLLPTISGATLVADGFLKDLALALRNLRSSPTFGVVAAITLAIGIGANSAIFSLADLIIRRPVALPNIERLAVVTERPMGSEDEGISPANYRDLGATSRSFEELAAYEYWSASASRGGRVEEIHGVKVTPNFFATVGVRAALGRTFDEGSWNSREVVISNSLWKQRLGAQTAALGANLELNGEAYTVIGVLPARATFPLGAPAFWIPLTVDSKLQAERSDLNWNAVGRLRTGVTLEQARGEINSLWRQLSDLYPKANQSRTLEVLSLHDHIVLDYNRQFALLLLGAAGFVLLIVCANLAMLQLARGARRQQELAIRSALGASRWRLFRQMLLESMLLALIGGGLGGGLAVYGTALLRRTLPSDVRWFCDVEGLQLNLSGILFTSLIAIAAGLMTGLVPAWQHSKAEIGTALVEGGERIVGRRQHLWRAAFVITQMALAIILLIGATLMVKGFGVLVAGQSGLEPSSLLTFHLTLDSRYSPSSKVVHFQEQLLQQLSALPGVTTAALASGLPYTFYEDHSDLIIRGEASSSSGQGPVAMSEAISSDYFRIMRIALVAGREFNLSDNENTLPVCIVSKSMAQRLWPGQDPVGKQLKINSDRADGGWITAVGVVEDVQHEIYDRSFRSVLYRPYRQAPPHAMDFALRDGNNPVELVAAVHSAIRKLDPDLAAENIESMAEVIASQASGLRYVASLMAGFGVLALILAALGIYGVMANSVTERWREIAIRIALGAGSERLLLSIIGRAMLHCMAGAMAGLVVALSLARLMATLIYGVSVWDKQTFVMIPVFLLVVAFFACYGPARPATRMDPMATLRRQ